MNSDKNLKDIDSLILDFLHGVIDQQGKEELRTWISSNSSNKAYFRQMYLLWKASSIHYFKSEKIESAYQKLSPGNSKSQTTELSASSSGKSKYVIMTFRKLAAIIILSLLIGAVAITFFQKYHSGTSDNKAQNIVNVPLGSKSEITLPDGSEVYLNAGSKLSYTMNYGKKLREVRLVGEGYFKVAKQADKPFIVNTSGASIRAVGTEFNVKAYPEENIIETILVKGSVVVSKTTSKEYVSDFGDKESVVLTQGQKAQIFKEQKVARNNAVTNGEINHSESGKVSHSINVKKSNTEVETSWKDPNWVIQSADLNDLFVLFERRFNVTIISKSGELSRYHFSGIIQNETLEQVLSIVSLTIPISYSIDKGRVEVTLNQKLENRYQRAYKH
jgi:Fe2+-dicitrate sensor, membrane component